MTAQFPPIKDMLRIDIKILRQIDSKKNKHIQIERETFSLQNLKIYIDIEKDIYYINYTIVNFLIFFVEKHNFATQHKNFANYLEKSSKQIVGLEISWGDRYFLIYIDI